MSDSSRFWIERFRAPPVAVRALVVPQVWIFALPFLTGLVPWREVLLGGPALANWWHHLGGLLPFAESLEQPSRFFTAGALHAGIIHLAPNMLALTSVGGLLERLGGSRHLLFVYVVSGLAGMVASSFQLDSLSVGASGAVFGVGWAAIANVVRVRHRLPRGAAWRLAGPLTFMLLLALFGLMLLPAGLVRIDHAAHFGGSAAGLVLGLAPRPRGLGGVFRIGFIGVLLALGSTMVPPVVRTLLASRDPVTDVLGTAEPELVPELIESLRLRLSVPRHWQRRSGEGDLPQWFQGDRPVLELIYERSAHGTPDIPGHVDLLKRDFETQEEEGRFMGQEVFLDEDLLGQGPGGYLLGFRIDWGWGQQQVVIFRLLGTPRGSLTLRAQDADGEYQVEILERVLGSLEIVR